MRWAGHTEPQASPEPPGIRTGTGPGMLPQQGGVSQHLLQAPTPPCLTPAFTPLLALPLPSWGMHKKPREPEATAKRSPQRLLGTSLLRGVPHSHPMVQHGGRQLQHLLGCRCPMLIPSHGRAPQPWSCSHTHTHTPRRDIAPELQPCSHCPSQGQAFVLGGAPREAAHPHLRGISRAKGDLSQDREPAPALARVWLSRGLGCQLCTHPCRVGAPHSSQEPL